MKKEITCIVCPMGCRMTAEICPDGPKVTGNTCRRGVDYAVAELTAPTRTVTSTVRLSGGGSVSVKTREPIAKDKIFDLMRILRTTTVDAPVRIGDVILSDVFGTDIVATADAGKEA